MKKCDDPGALGSSAAKHVHTGPGGQVPPRASDGRVGRKTSVASVAMEFGIVQYTDIGLCHSLVFGRARADCDGRLACGALHIRRLLLAPCGNSPSDSVFRRQCCR